MLIDCPPILTTHNRIRRGIRCSHRGSATGIGRSGLVLGCGIDFNFILLRDVCKVHLPTLLARSLCGLMGRDRTERIPFLRHERS